MSGEKLISVRNLRTSFGHGDNKTEVVQGVSFDLHKGEVLGLIGESGSGKTVTGLSILQLLPENASVIADTLSYRDQELLALDQKAVKKLRGLDLAMVFQDPVGSFNPSKTIRWHLECALERCEPGTSRTERSAKSEGLLKRVNIRDTARTLGSYPHQLSGGMLQRVLIALVFCMRPKVVVADEPTTNLDNLVERQILSLVREQQKEVGTGVIFVTHDLMVARHLCDRICVMYSGRIVEMGSTEEILGNPRHPYTIGLLKTAQSLSDRDEVLYEIKGEPGASSWNDRCAFAARCISATEECLKSSPRETEIACGHMVRCINHGE